MIYINENLIPFIKEMLYELEENRLKVCLVPSEDEQCAKDGGMIRAATSINPVWYQELCAMYPPMNWKKGNGFNKKKKRTILKRYNILQILRRMIKYKKSKSMHAEYLLDIAKDRKESYEDSFIPWNNQF